jgi:hypothetical protein
MYANLRRRRMPMIVVDAAALPAARAAAPAATPFHGGRGGSSVRDASRSSRRPWTLAGSVVAVDSTVGAGSTVRKARRAPIVAVGRGPGAEACT